MTYATGGLISATDYNTLAASINTIYSTGNGESGYGQPAVTNVAAAATVTATQWATLIGAINKTLAHQSGTAAIALPTAGNVITYLASVNTGVTTAATNKAAYASSGATVASGTNVWNPVIGATAALNAFVDTNVTFASADAARYFFNCGGRINFVCSAVDNAATTRSTALRDSINQMGGLSAFSNSTNGGRIGTGGTLATNNTAIGYRSINTGAQAVVQISEDAPYSGNSTAIYVFCNAADSTNGSISASVVFRTQLVASADDAFGGTINLSVSTRADIIYPETTNIANTWGTPTITFDNV